LHSFTKKIILHASGNGSAAESPSENLVELLQCGLGKIGLLLLISVARKENKDVFIQPNLVITLLRRYIVV